MLLADLIEAVITRASLHGGKFHVLRAQDVLKRFTQFVERRTVQNPSATVVTQDLLERYLAERKTQISRKTGKPITAATLNCEIRYLNLFGPVLEKKTAQELGVAEKWPTPHVSRVRQPKRMPVTMKMEDFEATLMSTQYASRPTFPKISAQGWWVNLFIVNYVTGIRCRGLLSVPRPSENDLNNYILRLPAEHTKNGVEREFPLNDIAVNAIRSMPVAPGETLFAWPYDITWFYQVLHRFQSDAGIPRSLHGLPHKLRKTLCTTMLRGGADLVVAQRIMQHSTPTLTANDYCGLVTDQERAAINKLPMPSTVHAPQTPGLPA